MIYSTAFPHRAPSTLDKSFALTPPRNIPLSSAAGPHAQRLLDEPMADPSADRRPKRSNNALEQPGAKPTTESKWRTPK